MRPLREEVMNVARVIPNRMTVEIEGDFVVFLIGMNSER
jgi:hypothetical protein